MLEKLFEVDLHGSAFRKKCYYREFSVVIFLCIFSSYVGGYICQYIPSAIVLSIIPRQSRQRFSTGTHAVIKVQSHISTLKHTLYLLRLCFFYEGSSPDKLWTSKHSFFQVYIPKYPICYSILAKHPILHVAPPKLFLSDSILLPSFEMPFVYYLYQS